MKKIIFALSLLPVSLLAQVDLGNPSSTGKGGVATAITQDWQCIGINPANLGFTDNYKFSLGLANIGVSIQSRALDFKTLYKAATDPNATFTQADKQKLAQDLSSPDGLNIYANLNWFAASFFSPTAGGFAINLRDRVSGHATLSKNAADIIFNGANSTPYQNPAILNQPVGFVLNGTRASYLHYRELNLCYGRRLLGKDDGMQLFAGIGFKYLWGIGEMNMKAEGNKVTGHAAFSSNYGFNPGFIRNFSLQTTDNAFNTVGKGQAFDFGASLKISERLVLSASLTDLGSIRWTKNSVVVLDTTMPKLDSSQVGVLNWDQNSITGFLYNTIAGAVKFTGGPAYSTQLPTLLRTGAGLKLGKKLLLGVDAVFPVNGDNGNLENPFIAFGGELNLWGTAKLSSGISGNKNYGYAVPLGFTIGTIGITELYVATNDVLSFLNVSKSPKLSFAFAVLRFNIKRLTEAGK